MFVVRAEVVQLAEVKRTVEGRTLISSCDVVGEPEPTIEWRRSGRLRPYVLGAQPVSNAVFLCGVFTIHCCVFVVHVLLIFLLFSFFRYY